MFPWKILKLFWAPGEPEASSKLHFFPCVMGMPVPSLPSSRGAADLLTQNITVHSGQGEELRVGGAQ